MSDGQKVADETKGVFKGIGQIGGDIRNNVNSFADNVVGSTHASGGHSSSSTSGLTSSSAKSGDIHPDAKKAGDGLAQTVDSASKKLDESLNKR